MRFNALKHYLFGCVFISPETHHIFSLGNVIMDYQYIIQVNTIRLTDCARNNIKSG